MSPSASEGKLAYLRDLSVRSWGALASESWLFYRSLSVTDGKCEVRLAKSLLNVKTSSLLSQVFWAIFLSILTQIIQNYFFET